MADADLFDYQDMPASNEQMIITFEGPNHEIKKYTTAYTDEQAKHYLIRCMMKHGRAAKARIVFGAELA